jgi:hypothetical protein
MGVTVGEIDTERSLVKDYRMPNARNASGQPEERENILSCPNCRHSLRPGELVCPQCGMTLSGVGKTVKLDKAHDEPIEKVRRVGQAVAQQAKALQLSIGEESIELPIADSVILGRATTSPTEAQPTVDLRPFQAREHGLSRLHASIVRERDVFRVIDLGSLNGTHLNGVKLIPNQARLLRNGDELLLGRLRIHVRF